MLENGYLYEFDIDMNSLQLHVLIYTTAKLMQ